jgi:hypothetical protein
VRYAEKRETIYVDIEPATKDHVAVVPLDTPPSETYIGFIVRPDGQEFVYPGDVIIDYGPDAAPRYMRMPEDNVSAFYEKAPLSSADTKALASKAGE